MIRIPTASSHVSEEVRYQAVRQAYTSPTISIVTPLRERIARTFNDSELKDLCFEHFQAVYDEFTAGMTKGQMIQLLLGYCVRHQLGSALLDVLEQARPGLIDGDHQSLLEGLLACRPLPLTQDQSNRSRMLQKVRDLWVKDVLEKSLDGAAPIALGMEVCPSAISHPWETIIYREDQTPRPLPAAIPIVTVFDDLGGELLILGEPGSGKTTMLLELARALLDRAGQDEGHPIPVVFQLSTWTPSKKPFTDWLVEELNQRYFVPSKMAQSWIDADTVLPLLDGLDEMRAEYRNACVEAINDYRREHGLLPLVVCSRSADYATLITRLELRGAVQLQPLTLRQIDSYLALAVTGDQLVALRAAIEHDGRLSGLNVTPLLLRIMKVAYQGQSTSTPVDRDISTDGYRQPIAVYVQQMLTRSQYRAFATPQQTMHWLTWLARGMVAQGQSVFYIEHLQPSWLANRAQRWAYLAIIAMINGLAAALCIGLAGGPVFGLFAGQAGGLGYGLGGGLIGGLIGGLVFGLIGVLVFGRSSELRPITIMETLRLSWSSLKSNSKSMLVYGLVCGLMITLLFWPIFKLKGGLSIGVPAGVFGGLSSVLLYGVVSGELDTRGVPNQGIWRTRRNALLSGLAGVLVGGLSGGLSGSLLDWQTSSSGLRWVWGPTGILCGAVITGLFLGLANGGLACIQHLALRLTLWRNSAIPWNYARFLDEAAKRVLLHKVGGGYMFVHRVLLEYFASLDDAELDQ